MTDPLTPLAGWNGSASGRTLRPLPNIAQAGMPISYVGVGGDRSSATKRELNIPFDLA